MKKEYDFSGGRRGPVIAPDQGKTRITIRIDDDVLGWFRARVSEAGGGNYQTLINDALREHIGLHREDLESKIRRLVRETVSLSGRFSDVSDNRTDVSELLAVGAGCGIGVAADRDLRRSGRTSRAPASCPREHAGGIRGVRERGHQRARCAGLGLWRGVARGSSAARFSAALREYFARGVWPESRRDFGALAHRCVGGSEWSRSSRLGRRASWALCRSARWIHRARFER